jgi:hypothetical protein
MNSGPLSLRSIAGVVAATWEVSVPLIIESTTAAASGGSVGTGLTAIGALGTKAVLSEALAESGDEAVQAATNVPKITFGHGARHLEGTGLGVEEVESTILEQVTSDASKATSGTSSFWGRIEIKGTTVEYRAYTLPDGTINVGTYYVP